MTQRVNTWLGFSPYAIGVFTLPIEMIDAQSELNRIWRGETARAPATAVVATP